MSDDLTPTRQPRQYTTGQMVAALESTWATIRTHHPDVPAVVVVIGSGGARKFGHFAASSWQHGESRLPEVLISSEGMSRTPDKVLTTLVHEAAHGLAQTRSITDTSRNGRYHNKRFLNLADELGLDAERVPVIGWSACTLRPATRDRYAVELAALTAAMTAYRHPDHRGEKRVTSSITASCACPRKIRVTRSVFDAGAIICAECRSYFAEDRA